MLQYPVVGCNLNQVKEKYDVLVELAVWGHLDSKSELELILLKGHLIIEQILEAKLNRAGIEIGNTLSFYSKILALEKLSFEQSQKKTIIIYSLKGLNKLRNNLAHDFYFDMYNGEFESWAKHVLRNMFGEKYTRYTYRTKIVHAFSILTINILELTIKEKHYEDENI
ncbi:hypothetical protein C21_04624 [Arenibacter sp. NBRC 103722]|nr:hypothetical protein C21_04624 [Arenibacter sp. NBRC 103722]